MTPRDQQPQREYTITEEEVQIIEWKGGNTLAAKIRTRPHALAPECHAAFVPITQDEYDYLMKGWGNEHTEQIDEDVRQRQAAYINCCNCGVPKTSDGEPNCNECAFSEQHDAAIAQAATLAARKDVAEEIWNASHRMWEGCLVTDIGALERKLESLRQQSTAGADPK